MKSETQIYPFVGSSDDYTEGGKKYVGECTQRKYVNSSYYEDI